MKVDNNKKKNFFCVRSTKSVVSQSQHMLVPVGIEIAMSSGLKLIVGSHGTIIAITWDCILII